MFKIEAGTRAWVKRETETAWRDIVLAEDLEFVRRHGLADDGGRWVFRLDDSTLLKVGPRLVAGRKPRRTDTARPAGS